MFKSVSSIVRLALEEDIASGDVSADLISEEILATAKIINREPMTLCGQDYVNETFNQVDNTIQVTWDFNDGEQLPINSRLCTLKGRAKKILSAERTALNFLQCLSATATYTHHLNQLIKHTNAKLLDTRKTIPGLRMAQKYAVKCGGGTNHRMGLYDAFLLKENHIHAAGSITKAVEQARKLRNDLLLEVEVENLLQLQEALDCQVERIMLDNFDLPMLKKAVALNQASVVKKAELEASGNISEENIVAVAETGVDYISVGKLTKDIRAIDLSLRFE